MTLLPPRSLFGQTLLILLIGLVLSHLVGARLYDNDKEQAVRNIGGFVVAERIANLTALINDAPREWRPRIVEALNDQVFRVTLFDQPPNFPSEEETAPISRTVRTFIAGLIPGKLESRLRVAVEAGPVMNSRLALHGVLDPAMDHSRPSRFMGMDMRPGMGMGMHAYDRGGTSWRGLRAAVQLSDGQWVSFATQLPDAAPAFSLRFFFLMAMMGVIVVAVSIWAVRLVTAPLGILASAAERLGKDVAAPPLEEIGTVEMRQAIRAFNRMQQGLRRMIQNRTLMLAAISHDMRTPLTLLRLRTEALDSGENRDRMLATIDDMSAMLGAYLSFAREEAKDEQRRPVDVSSLLGSIVDDMADAGFPVDMTDRPDSEPYLCQSLALRRAITNLIDNAIAYGSHAHVTMVPARDAIEITVDDDGPGLPDEELAKVVQSFYRVEGSRNRESGGIGLGLAIAQSIVQAHGGQLNLTNRPEGGLRASLTLPR